MTFRTLGALVLGGLGILSVAGGCGGDDDGGGGGGKAGSDAATGGSGGIGGGVGGSGGGTGGGGATGGSAGSGGCPAAPDDCATCEDDEHGSCVCLAQEDACFADVDCANIVDCIYAERDSGGPGPCLELSADGAACVLACADAFPNGKEKYLAYDACIYCDYCQTACGADEYCAAFIGTEAGTGGSAGSAGAASDAASGD